MVVVVKRADMIKGSTENGVRSGSATGMLSATKTERRVNRGDVDFGLNEEEGEKESDAEIVELLSLGK